MLYEFKFDHNTMETTKNICCEKGKDTVDHKKVQEMLLRSQELWLGKVR